MLNSSIGNYVMVSINKPQNHKLALYDLDQRELSTQSQLSHFMSSTYCKQKSSVVQAPRMTLYPEQRHRQ